MDLTHRFTVPTDVETTWAHFEDIEGLASCFPGATVTSVEGDSFKGTVKVKLGPIALTYSGSGTFVDKDDATHSFKVDAKGKDKRGNGTAGAKVDLSMGTADSGSGTEVTVLTDLAITGKPAQFGRGVMQDVSDKLLGQFVSCLEERLSASPVDGSGSETAAGEPVAAPSPAAGTVAAAPSSSQSTDTMGGPPPSARPQPPPAPPRPAANDDSLDLGATVLPVLLKSYWKPIAAVVGLGAAVLIWWRRS